MLKRFIVTSGGGLGNQIIQYALWIYLTKQGYKTTLYLRVNDIGRIFPYSGIPKVPFIDKLMVKNRRIIKFVTDIFCGLKEKRRARDYPILFYRKIEDFPLWKDYSFIRRIKEDLCYRLVFPEDSDERNQNIKNEMLHTNSVSIHVRRGDYQSSKYWRAILGDICEGDYYNKAITKVKEIISNPVFFVFSDDIEWVKDNIIIDNPVYIDWNKGYNSFRDLELMTFCKVNIIANSTFSLCATYLNRNSDSIRIAPVKWRHIYEDNLKNKYLNNNEGIIIDNSRPNISICCSHELSDEEIFNIKKQTYSDFEVISQYLTNDDKRFHDGSPIGNYIYKYATVDMVNFKNRRFLQQWLYHQFDNSST